MSLFTSRLRLLLNQISATSISAVRGVTRIPHWENHIRFDPRFGRKRPCQDVLDRFKRLNNGMWIRTQAGRHVRRYAKDEVFNETSQEFVTCTKEECMMLDKMMSPFWLRRPHYVDDPYEPYHTRHGITEPRVDDNKRLVRERRKVLLEDTVADKFFNDR